MQRAVRVRLNPTPADAKLKDRDVKTTMTALCGDSIASKPHVTLSQCTLVSSLCLSLHLF